MLSTLLFLVVIAILLPAVFDVTERTAARGTDISLIDERLSLGVSVVLLLLYAANLVYTLVTHRDVFAGDAPGGEPEWSPARALAVMVAGTAVIAVEAELASAALEATSTQLGLSPVFMGVVVLALVGTAADLFAAVVFARQDKMDIVFSMCIGSAIQIALVVAPVLVLASWVIGYPMNLVFRSPLDLLRDRQRGVHRSGDRRGRRDHVVRGSAAGRRLPAVRAGLLFRGPGLSLRAWPKKPMSPFEFTNRCLVASPAIPLTDRFEPLVGEHRRPVRSHRGPAVTYLI